MSASGSFSRRGDGLRLVLQCVKTGMTRNGF
jgi:hypothetical protein